MAVAGGFAVPACRLRGVGDNAHSLGVEPGQRELRIHVAKPGGSPEIGRAEKGVSRSALALKKQIGEFARRNGMALFRRLFQQVGGLGKILLDAGSVEIEAAERVERLGVALRRREAVPIRRGGEVLLDAQAARQELPEERLRRRV